MAHNEALLQAVIDEPDDDAPRLVYADWLEEHGEADRSEFIRVQISLDKMALNDPRRPALRSREASLLMHHSREWAEHLEVRDWFFRRGFVEWVEPYPDDNCGADLRLAFQRAPIRHVRDVTSGDVAWVVKSLPELTAPDR